MIGPLQPVSPLLQCHLNGQQLTSEVPTSRTKGNSGSGSTRMGADVKRCLRELKAWLALVVHVKGTLDFLVSEVRVTAT